MFTHCIKLKKIKGIENFNTNNVINMSTMFQECHELEELDLSNFKNGDWRLGIGPNPQSPIPI